MIHVLIADACKPSLVMTSEVFKDKLPGTIVDVALNGKDTLELLKEKNPTICVIDFDLPDVDGASLYEAIRKLYNGPILITAYPDPTIKEAINKHLFAFNDASDWVSKPVTFDSLSEKIDKLLVDGFRVSKRFDGDMETQVIGKASGRGKRAPKVDGKVMDISLTGARINHKGVFKVKKDEEVTLSLAIPSEMTVQSKAKKGAVKGETKIKATVAWSKSGGEFGVHFERLTDVQRNLLETYFQTQLNNETTVG